MFVLCDIVNISYNTKPQSKKSESILKSSLLEEKSQIRYYFEISMMKVLPCWFQIIPHEKKYVVFQK